VHKSITVMPLTDKTSARPPTLEKVYLNSLHDIAILKMGPALIPANAHQLDLEYDYALTAARQQ
jgi:hypothetical protein